MPLAAIASPAEIVDFWFAPGVQPLWFAATPDFDEALRERFLTTYAAGAAGQLAHWDVTPKERWRSPSFWINSRLNLFRG